MRKIIGTIDNYTIYLFLLEEEDTAFELDLDLGTFLLDFKNQLSKKIEFWVPLIKDQDGQFSINEEYIIKNQHKSWFYKKILLPQELKAVAKKYLKLLVFT